MIPIADAIDPRIKVVFVRGPLVLGAAQFAWFRVRFGLQGPVINAQQASESRVHLRLLVRSLGSSDSGEPVSAVMAGFSQGGILSSSVALSAPDDVSSFAILSGRILPELGPDLTPPAKLPRLSTLIARGRYDDKLPVTFAEHADAWLTRVGVPHEMRLYPVGHTLNADIIGDFCRWVNQHVALD
jgi:phospholipase/carboxylesterase